MRINQLILGGCQKEEKYAECKTKEKSENSVWTKDFIGATEISLGVTVNPVQVPHAKKGEQLPLQLLSR